MSASPLLNFSRQQRNLLLLRPLFSLDFSKAKYQSVGSILARLDTHYLALATLNYMMEGTAVQWGRKMVEVHEYLAQTVQFLDPAIPNDKAQRIGELVLDALDNASNQYAEHSFPYYDALSGKNRDYTYRLASYEPDLEDTFRYRPTSEGYMVLMGMLDLDVTDKQILIDKMMSLMIERGRFGEALQMAQTAYNLSMQHSQVINDVITQAWRSPGSIKWKQDVEPGLTVARTHVQQRQDEARLMGDAVREQLLTTTDVAAREHLSRLNDLLVLASARRAQLQIDIGNAGPRFVQYQTTAFRARRPTGLPDFEAHLLPMVMRMDNEVLAEKADDILAALFPAKRRRVPDLTTFITALMDTRTMDRTPEQDEEGEIQPFEPYPNHFLAELEAATEQWLQERFARDSEVSLDKLLADGEAEGLSERARQYIVLALYRSFAISETLFKPFTSVVDGTFKTPFARGDNLRFTLIKPAEAASA